MAEQIELTDRTRATRNKLLSVARQVFEADGYDGSSVSRIVEAAQVSRGTFYLYFDSKEDVFRAVAESLQADIMKAQEWPANDPPQEILRKSTERFLRFYRDNALMMAVLDQVATHAPEFKSLRLTMRRATARRASRFINDLQERGLASTTLDPRYAGVALNGMIDRFANVWFVLGEDFELDAAVATLTELWARSIGLEYPPPA